MIPACRAGCSGSNPDRGVLPCRIDYDDPQARVCAWLGSHHTRPDRRAPSSLRLNPLFCVEASTGFSRDRALADVLERGLLEGRFVIGGLRWLSVPLLGLCRLGLIWCPCGNPNKMVPTGGTAGARAGGIPVHYEDPSNRPEDRAENEPTPHQGTRDGEQDDDDPPELVTSTHQR